MLKPLGNRLVIEQVPEKENRYGIYRPDTVKNTHLEGLVLAVGDEVTEVKEGENIIYAPFVAKEFHLEGKQLFLVTQEDVLAVVNE